MLTLKKLHLARFDHDIVNKLLASLGKTEVDDDSLSLITILDSVGLFYALRCLIALPASLDKDVILLACDIAQNSVWLDLHFHDQRLATIGIVRRFALGHITIAELSDEHYAAQRRTSNETSNYIASAMSALANVRPEVAFVADSSSCAHYASVISANSGCEEAAQEAQSVATAEQVEIFVYWVMQHGL